jgi:hypothetical protein
MAIGIPKSRMKFGDDGLQDALDAGCKVEESAGSIFSEIEAQ